MDADACSKPVSRQHVLISATAINAIDHQEAFVCCEHVSVNMTERIREVCMFSTEKCQHDV